jgi:hypothetical protein
MVHDPSNVILCIVDQLGIVFEDNGVRGARVDDAPPDRRMTRGTSNHGWRAYMLAYGCRMGCHLIGRQVFAVDTGLDVDAIEPERVEMVTKSCETRPSSGCLEADDIDVMHYHIAGFFSRDMVSPTMDSWVVLLVSSLATWLYFWNAERDTYRASWRIHTAGILLPIVLMTRTRDPVIQAIAASFATVHVASIVSESDRVK